MRKRPGFGTLLIIGGKEDKEDERIILRMLAEEVGKSAKLVVATVASESPRELFDDYEVCLRGLGMRHIHHLSIESREEAQVESKLKVLRDAAAVFFTGGDQLKITSQIGDTPVYSRVREIYEAGGLRRIERGLNRGLMTHRGRRTKGIDHRGLIESRGQKASIIAD